MSQQAQYTEKDETHQRNNTLYLEKVSRKLVAFTLSWETSAQENLTPEASDRPETRLELLAFIISDLQEPSPSQILGTLVRCVYPVVIITCVHYLGPPGPFSFPDSRDLLLF
ncbi:MAG: hypothetical protein QF745_08825, partial [Planctomycetota bacterium]|nr:hypothetical protein [Planctomycetota bacterium]